MTETIIVRKNNFVSKARYWLNAPSRAMVAAYTAIMTGMMTVAPTFCAPTNTTMNSLFKSMVDIVCQIAFYVGAIIIVSGVFNWVLAQKDENADGQSRAIKFIVCGFALVALKLLVNPLLTNMGLGGS